MAGQWSLPHTHSEVDAILAKRTIKTEKMALQPVSTLKKITDFLSLDPFPDKTNLGTVV